MTTGKSTPQSPARQRKTRQLEAVLSAVRGMTDFQSAADIFTKLQLNGTPVGLATVYRNLAALAEDGSWTRSSPPMALPCIESARVPNTITTWCVGVAERPKSSI